MFGNRISVWAFPDSLYLWQDARHRHQTARKRERGNHQYAAGTWDESGAVLKCVCAIVTCSLIFGKTHPDMVYLFKMYAAAGAILGHNFPFYLGFKGGKGIAATAGLILSFHPAFLPVGVVLFFGAFLLTHYVSLGSWLVYAGFIIEIIVLGQMGLFGGMSQEALAEMYLIAGFLTVMAYYKHRENIKRLLKGEERKTYLIKKNKEE